MYAHKFTVSCSLTNYRNYSPTTFTRGKLVCSAVFAFPPGFTLDTFDLIQFAAIEFTSKVSNSEKHIRPE